MLVTYSSDSTVQSYLSAPLRAVRAHRRGAVPYGERQELGALIEGWRRMPRPVDGTYSQAAMWVQWSQKKARFK